MKSTDIKIDENYDVSTNPTSHDFEVGDVTLQNQALIIASQKGEWKENPMLGCGIDDMANDETTAGWQRSIREELERDGLSVSKIKINNGLIEIEAQYEND